MSADWSDEIVKRARVHAALGEPARLAIVDMLALGDAAPGEIGAHLTMPTNLVAHHLRVLQDAGVVDRSRSHGDARRTYVRLNLEVAGAVGNAMAAPAARIVFVCTHNSARSQLAAALWPDRSSVPAVSAGTQPSTVHPRTIAVARRHRVSLDRPPLTRDVKDVLRNDDLVVAVCDNAHEQMPAAIKRLHWSVADPAIVDTDAAFEAAFAEIATRLDRLAQAVHLPGGSRDRN